MSSIICRSLAGHPIKKPKKFAPQRIVFVFGAIGPTLGNVIYHMDKRSFNQADIKEILREIRARAGPDKKLAMVWDQALIHTARSV